MLQMPLAHASSFAVRFGVVKGVRCGCRVSVWYDKNIYFKRIRKVVKEIQKRLVDIRCGLCLGGGAIKAGITCGLPLLARIL